MQKSKNKTAKTRFITDDHGKKVAVILSMKDYEKILDELDELACIKAYDRASEYKHSFSPAAGVFEKIERKRRKS